MPFSERYTSEGKIEDTLTNTYQTWSSSKIASSITAGGVGATGPAGPTGPTGATGATGPAGATGLSSSLFEYRLDRNTFVVTGIAPGDIRFNNTDLTLATTVWVSHVDDFNNDVERFIGTIAEGSNIIIQDKSNSTNYVMYRVDPVVSQVVGSHISIPVTYLEGVGLASLVNAHPVFLALQFIVAPTFAVGTTTTLSAGSSATVTNVGTSNDVILNFGIPSGASGASADLEYTFSQFSYYGTVPTANLFNMATGVISNLGGSLGIPTQAGTSQLAKSYRVRSNTTSVGNGQVSGWYGTSASPQVYIGQGFKFTYSFGLEDTSTNASTRTMIGIQQASAPNTLSSTATVASLTIQSLCVMQESGENTFSFYSRGASTFSKLNSLITCQTVNTGWYTLVIHNEANSADVTMKLKYVAGGAVSESNAVITCGTAGTPSLTAPCFVIIQRNMSSAGGVTGSAILSLGGIKMYYR